MNKRYKRYNHHRDINISNLSYYTNSIGFTYLKLTVTSQIDREIGYISTQMDLSVGKQPNTHFYSKQQHTIQNSIVIYKRAIEIEINS